MSVLSLTRVESPIGAVVALEDEHGLCWLDFEDSGRLERLLPQPATRPARGAPIGAALHAYFDGQLDALDGFARVPPGTLLQRAVWSALIQISAGSTCSYGELAGRIGSPRAARAVGAANARNPLGLVLPCHRVVGADGGLTGYGGGLERKRWLLRHEGALG